MPPSTQKSRSATHNQAKTLPKPLLHLAAPNEENRQQNAVTMTTKSDNSAGDAFNKSGNPTSTPPQVKAPIRPYARLRAQRMMSSGKNYAAKIFDPAEVRIGDARHTVVFGHAGCSAGSGESWAAGVGEIVRFGIGDEDDDDDGAGEILECFLNSRPRCGSGRLCAAVAKKPEGDNQDGGVFLADFAVFVD